jgi:hypothetical protein
MLYRVKLGDDTSPEHNIDGYLGDKDFSETPMIYSRGEALKKALAFKGKIEPYQFSKCIGRLSIQTIPQNALVYSIEKELQGRESFTDTIEDLNEKIFSGDIFQTILCEQNELAKSGCLIQMDAKGIAQLNDLVQMIDADYVLITKV